LCWFIHGALRGNIDENALREINGRHTCHIAKGTRHDLKMAVLEETWDYRVTEEYCDCGSEIGGWDPDAPLVADLAELISEISALPGAKTLSMSKSWVGERNRYDETLKLSELDLRQWLAEFEARTLYTIDLQK